MSDKVKKILIAIVIIFVLFFVYRLFFAGSVSIPALSVQTAAGTDTSIQAGKEFLVALLNLSHINLDAGAVVLKDSNFVRLRDMSVSLPDEPQGRPDPFKPIGDDKNTPSPSRESSTPVGI